MHRIEVAKWFIVIDESGWTRVVAETADGREWVLGAGLFESVYAVPAPLRTKEEG